MQTILQSGTPRSTSSVPPKAAWDIAIGALVRATLATVETLVAWMHRAKTRRHLGTLDDRMLRDIGLDRGTVWTETQKPFWRP